MSDKTKFTVRPFSRPARTDLKDALRVNISASALLSLKLRAGDLCLLERDGLPDQPAIAWQAVEKIQDTVVQISKQIQELYELKLGDKISILNTERPIDDAETVVLHEVRPDDASTGEELSPEDLPHWAWIIQDPLSRAGSLICGLQFESVQARGQKRSFVISHIDGADATSSSSIFKFAPTTRVSISKLEDEVMNDQDSAARRVLRVNDTRVGGLSRQLAQINLILRRFELHFQALTSPYNYQPSQGLLMYGSKGTGKTLLIDELAASPWRNVIRWSGVSTGRSDPSEQLQKMFSAALQQQPCLVVIEQIEAVASKRAGTESSSIQTLLPAIRKGFELIRKTAVLVVAEVRHPNDIDESLRIQTRFGIEIELPVPAANERLEILRCIRGAADQPTEGVLKDVAERTHGYVGADLFALYQRIIELAAHRTLSLEDGMGMKLDKLSINSANVDGQYHCESISAPASTLAILPNDITQALSQTRPTAMQEVFLETPNVHWSDIGGHYTTKQHLRRSVSRPLVHSSTMTRLNLRTNRGILLYGPPGCSKTLLVKALATEAGLNFLAVKGAELVSMYVGESERAVREVFRKARAASPSIIFFDEFDSIASIRSSSNAGGGGSLNILTTLLNEMDGFEQLRNVLIVAATNRPEILDPALLRPGRLDNLVYVGPPDLEAREEIFRIWCVKSDVRKNVDVRVLAQMTPGYSGAEIVSICETAGGLAMDEAEERVTKGGKSYLEDDIEEMEKVKIGMEDFTRAVGEVRKGVTEEVVRAYEEWGAGRGES
jgi:AAA family ATPase